MSSRGNGGRAVRAWERPIGFWEGFRIRCAGWRDRIRTRNVTDDKPTHYLIALQERAQGFQVEVLRWISAEDARLEASIAAQEALLDQQPEEITTTAPRPDSESMKERAQWASSARASARAQTGRDNLRKQQVQARAAVRSLRVERHGLVERRDIDFASCQQWFEQRAAHYNRARTGCLGLPRSSEHKNPVFQPLLITPTRPIGDVEPGHGAEQVVR